MAVVLAVVTTALQKGVFENLIKNVVGFYTGYAQIHAKGYWNEQTLENAFSLTDTLAHHLNTSPAVEAIAPRLESFALISSGEKTKGCLVVGFDPTGENRITGLKAKVTQGSYPTTDSGFLVAEGLAKSMNARLGDTLVLLGQGSYGSTAAGKYAISGILHFGSPNLNSQLVFMPLPQAQTLFDSPELATTIVILPKNPEQLSGMLTDLRSRLPDSYEVMGWQEMLPEIDQHIRTDTGSMYIIMGVLYLLISFGIFSTLLMMVAERQREFGMLVAVGMHKSKIAAVLVWEALFITLSGCLLGIGISIPVAYLLKIHPIRITGEMAEVYERFGFEAIFPATTQADIFYNQAIVVLCISLVLSVYPVWRAMQLDPVTAMRR